jgi:hypothetical protein
MDMKACTVVVVTFGLAALMAADEKSEPKLDVFAGKWEGESKSKAIINVKLELDSAGKGTIRYRVKGDGGGVTDVASGALLTEKDGKFSLTDNEKTKKTWSVTLNKDKTTLTLEEAKSGETIILTKKTEK